MIDPAVLDRFVALVGDRNALTDPERIAPYLREWRDRYTGTSPLVLRPGTVDEVAAILCLASETGTAVVPQGGNTGLVGGQIPSDDNSQIVLSLARLDRIRDLDAAGNTMVVEAGVTLERAQAAAQGIDRLFPLSLASQGSCTIGGNIATNAGGTAVIAYGNMRDLVLGLEVVLADGRIWNGLRRLRKDNTGYDLRNLFIGSEGTLGVVTAAALKLFPRPRGLVTAFVAVATPADALAMLDICRARGPGEIMAFELMPRIGIEFGLRHIANTRDPLATPSPWYVLLEMATSGEAEDSEALGETLAACIEQGCATDGAIATSIEQARAFWRLREAMSEAQRYEGGSIKHDVAVPVALVPEFLDRALAAVTALVPGCRPVPFGHLGDGNIHFNVNQPIGADKAAFLDQWEAMNDEVHAIVAALGGSISAEHGIGVAKRDLLPGVKSQVELDLMRAIKMTLDPGGILNPGKVLPNA
jgi:FAD/FMN-containing dehydrogenase